MKAKALFGSMIGCVLSDEYAAAELAELGEDIGEPLTYTEPTLRGDWFQTFTGEQFFFHDVDPATIHLEDIAHSLAMQCRFNGHTREFYSVAEHSIHVAHCVCERFGLTSAKDLRTALFHDAAEAYIGDMVRPLKLEDVHFRTVEAEIEEAIAERFDLIWPRPPIIKRADNALLLCERNVLMAKPPRPWQQDEEPWQGAPECWSPEEAGLIFRRQAKEYLTPP